MHQPPFEISSGPSHVPSFELQLYFVSPPFGLFRTHSMCAAKSLASSLLLLEENLGELLSGDVAFRRVKSASAGPR